MPNFRVQKFTQSHSENGIGKNCVKMELLATSDQSAKFPRFSKFNKTWYSDPFLDAKYDGNIYFC